MSADADNVKANPVVYYFAWIFSSLLQIYAFYEFLSVLIGLFYGNIDPRFYVSILFIGTCMAVAVYVTRMIVKSSVFIAQIFSLYAVILSLFVVLYYFAIIANYEEILVGLQSSNPLPDINPSSAKIIAIGQIAVVFSLPILGLWYFARKLPAEISVYASIPLLLVFLWGLWTFRSIMMGNISESFVFYELPQVVMTFILFGLGIRLFSRYFSQNE